MIDIEVIDNKVVIKGVTSNIYTQELFVKKYLQFQNKDLGYFENDELLKQFFEQEPDLVIKKYPEILL